MLFTNLTTEKYRENIAIYCIILKYREISCVSLKNSIAQGWSEPVKQCKHFGNMQNWKLRTFWTWTPLLSQLDFWFTLACSVSPESQGSAQTLGPRVTMMRHRNYHAPLRPLTSMMPAWQLRNRFSRPAVFLVYIAANLALFLTLFFRVFLALWMVWPLLWPTGILHPGALATFFLWGSWLAGMSLEKWI